MKKSIIGSFLFTLLKVMLCGGIVATLFIPQLYDKFSVKGVEPFLEHSLLYQIAFFICYIISLAIIYVLIRILRDVYLETPFKKSTEMNLKAIAILFMLLAIIIAIKVIFIPTMLSIAVILATFIASLSFYVLSQVFKVANEYKHEIDHTI